MLTSKMTEIQNNKWIPAVPATLKEVDRRKLSVLGIDPESVVYSELPVGSETLVGIKDTPFDAAGTITLLTDIQVDLASR